jgi:hypothetical protein
MTLICPVCDTEFSSPILAECRTRGERVYCPRGHNLDWIPTQCLKPAEVQVSELERLYQLEVSD